MENGRLYDLAVLFFKKEMFMRDEDLSFNMKKHLLYSKDVKAAVRGYLNRNYEEKEAVLLWEKVQRIYVCFLKDQPQIGEGSNGQMQGVYDSILLFAFYEALPQKPSLEEFEEVCTAFFLKSYQKISRFDVNNKLIFKAAKLVTRYTAFQNRHKRHEFPANYIMEMEDSPDDVIAYKFYSCPIASFAKRHGCEFLMPAMCNPDYAMLKCVKASLIRTTTLGKDGTCCDYVITGDKNPVLKDHPILKDEKGFLYNK